MKKSLNILTFSLFFIAINSFASNHLEEKNELIDSLDMKISSLNKSIDKLSNKQQRLNNAIDKSRAVQTDINLTASNLVNYIESAYSTDKPIPIKISQKTNWYPYLLPLITIFIVIMTTFLSLRTIKIKSKESVLVLQDSNKTIVDVNNKNISEEHNRSQKTLIANNRQEWINSLRDEITLFLAIVASTAPLEELAKVPELEQKNLWLHNYKIQLLLNPNEDDHKELVDKMREEINNLILRKEETLISDIISISQVILKREWDRVKSFEKAS